METHPGKGVLIEDVSKHQETLSRAGLGEAFESHLGGQSNWEEK